MTAIAGEHIEKAPTGLMTKARLKWLTYATIGGLVALASARHGYDYWTVGRFIESTDDAYAGGNVTPISPHVAGFVTQILVDDNPIKRSPTIDISYETVRFWWNRFGPMFAAEIRKRRVLQMRCHPQWRWHLDEVFVKINGKLCYLWRAVDHEGEVLEAVVTAKRDKAAALKLIKVYKQRRLTALDEWRTLAA